MRRLASVVLLALASCTSWIPNLATRRFSAQLRVIESEASHARRKAELGCAGGGDPDTFMLHGRARAVSPDWVHMNGHGMVPSTGLCRALLDDPPKVGCPCTPELCVEFNEKPICQPERWAKLIDESLWSNDAVSVALKARPLLKLHYGMQPSAPADGFRVRWTGADELVVDLGPKARISNIRWALRHMTGALTFCDGEVALPEGASTAIALVESTAAGCRWVEGALQISAETLAQTEAIVVTADFTTHSDWTKEHGWDVVPVEMIAPRPVGTR